jgi:hypothetical protein
LRRLEHGVQKMAWVWDFPREMAEFGASFDYHASLPISGGAFYNPKHIDPTLRPVYKSRAGLRKFKKLHCPPMSDSIAVDAIWRNIILKFVPEDRIQFLPIRLIARGEICDDFFWPIVMDRVYCIDTEKSDITSKIQKPDHLFIYGVRTFVHIPGCLGKLHLARDARMAAHLLVSDELKEALSATGQDSPFYRPEDVPTLYNIGSRL